MYYSPAPLHIPDGFLSLIISLLFWAITAITVGIAISKSNKSLGEKQVPLMGVMAAFIFAAQMLNFPVAGGTSGHFLGGALAAMVLGPWAAILVMTAVIGVQALLFQDGGLLVMGANIFNMGILTAIIGFGLYRSMSGRKQGSATRHGGICRVAGRGRFGAGHRASTLVERHFAIADRSTRHARRTCSDRHRRGHRYGRGAGLHRADASRPVE